MQFKPPRQIKNKDGTWPTNSVEKGIFPEPGDNAILGRGSADMVVKKNEVIMRAGKYSQEPQSNITTPPNQNRSFLQLSILIEPKQVHKHFNKSRPSQLPYLLII